MISLPSGWAGGAPPDLHKSVCSRDALNSALCQLSIHRESLRARGVETNLTALRAATGNYGCAQVYVAGCFNSFSALCAIIPVPFAFTHLGFL